MRGCKLAAPCNLCPVQVPGQKLALLGLGLGDAALLAAAAAFAEGFGTSSALLSS